MPREALCVKDAVIQVLWSIGRVGPFARHPYEYRAHDVNCEVSCSRLVADLAHRNYAVQ